MKTSKYISTCIIFSALLTLAASFAIAPFARADYQTAAKAYQDKDYENAIVEFRQLAELGHTDSQYALGLMYFQGLGASQNSMLAYGWIRLAADAGNPAAKELEPKIRAQMDNESVERARSLLTKFTPAAIDQRLLPKLLQNCEYVDAHPPSFKGTRNGFPQYPFAFKQRGIQGFVVAELYVAADGTVRDAHVIESVPQGAFDAAVMYTLKTWKLRPAERNGVPFSTWVEVPFIFQMEGGAASGTVAKHLREIQSQAEEGNPAAQFVHGMLLYAYPSYGKQWTESLSWITKSAQGGFAQAQYRLGLSLLHGRGCEADAPKAAEWLLRAARQEHTEAQVELAKLALKTGPNYDSTKGLFWLERAAAGNDVKGRKYLAAVLAASPQEALRNHKRALELADAVYAVEKTDILVQEIRAAALASSGQFSDAAIIESEAIAAAKIRHWDLAELNARLESYQSGKPWYGDLLTF